MSSLCDWKSSMWSVLSRFSNSSTDFLMWSRLSAPSAGTMPHLVAIWTLARLAGFFFSQLPMIASDSPPLWPGTQRE